jgi:hypothetical protein
VTGKYNNENYWQLRAEEARAVAEYLRDPLSKRTMREIAAGYERLAKTSKQLEKYAAILGQATHSPVETRR